MLRIIRLIGIVAFALIVGISARSLQSMQESGELFERYNSQRRAEITLMGASMIMLCVLGGFELTRSRRHANRRLRYGKIRYQKPRPAGSSSNIYSLPWQHDEWRPRRTRSSRSKGNYAAWSLFWMKVLRICCFSMPFVFTFIYFRCLNNLLSNDIAPAVHIAVWSSLVAFSLITSMGICRKKFWGLLCGYVLTISSLVFFPYGTMAGLFMIIGLVGAMPLFVLPSRRSRRLKAA